MRKIFCVFVSLILLLAAAGCKKQPENNAATQQAPPQTVPVAAISPEVDEAAKKLLTEYFSLLYTAPSVDVYTESSRTGKLPDSITQFISERTLQEGNGNPEIGIHLPRHISINGMSITGYDLVLVGEQGVPDITSGFVGMNGENLLYFCKILTKVNALPDDIFLECYEQQDDNSFIRRKELPNAQMDGMRVEVRYDVELENNSGDLKIYRAIESNFKPGLKNRLFILNNESITRLPYLDLTKTSDDTYLYPEEGELYEKEKAVIENYFMNLPVLDRERMNLLSHKWDQGLQGVKEYWDTLKITKNSEGTADLIHLDQNFAVNYPYDSLPLRFDMEKIKGIQNVVVTPHPAYSEKIKWYFASFEAQVQKTNGITDEDYIYRYDYLVKLSTEFGSVIIEKVKLNEYHIVHQ